MRSEDLLRSRSGYERRPEDFDELLRILNHELRLITPTTPVDIASEAAVDGGGQPVPADETGTTPAEAKYYQLTHDYLVPSLRDWITAKHKATRRGRAQLRLEERATAWGAKPEYRNLPNFWEHLNIRWFTRARDWTESQCNLMRKVGRYHGAMVTLIVSLLVSSMGATLSAKRANDRQLAESYVDTTINAPTNAVAYTLGNLGKFPDDARVKLRGLFGDGTGQFENNAFTNMRQLHGLCALAAVGDVRIAALVAHVNREPFWPRGECENIVTALAVSPQASLQEIQRVANDERQWDRKARLAIVAMSLGDAKLASGMCQLGSDPIARTAWIAAFPSWHGNLKKLASDAERLAGASDPDLLSALCLGVGGVASTDRNMAEIDAWKPLFETWFHKHKSSAVHSAAGWAMRQWQLAEPKLPPRESPPARADADWFVTKSSLTMIRIPHGEFVRKDDEYDKDSKPQTVVLTRDMWLSDCEVTVKLFLEFSEGKTVAEKHPDDLLNEWWKGEERFGETAPQLDHPIQNVSWEDAVKFCNWLSRRENRKVWYRKVQRGEGPANATTDWELNEEGTGDGYRLPTEAEWEYACRAGTVVDFNYSFGDAEESLVDYGWFNLNTKSQTQPVGAKRPNGWGLHDMHGNVYEWCHDCRGAYRAAERLENPFGPRLKDSNRVIRGGSWGFSAGHCRSANRGRQSPGARYGFLGFRVALSSSGPASSVGAAEPPVE